MEQHKVFPTRIAIGSLVFLLIILVLVHITLYRASRSLESFSANDIPTLQLSSAATRVLNEIEFLSGDKDKNRDQIVIREHVLEDSLEGILEFSSDVPQARKILIDSTGYKNFLLYRKGEIKLSDYPQLYVELKNDLQDMVERYVVLKNKSITDQQVFLIISSLVSVLGAVFFFGLIYVIYRSYQENLKNFYKISESLEKERLISIQSAKLASLGEMAAGLAHEINNPLAVIIGKGEILLEKIQDNSTNDTEIMKTIGKMNEMAHRISKIVMSMKKISRGSTTSELSKVNLMDVLDDVLILLSQKFKSANIQFDASGVDQNCHVSANFSHLNQVLINLLNNASDELSKLTTDEKSITVASREENGHVYLTVKDSGPGIPDNIREKLFQPFFTTKDVGKGTGLGLSISRGLMKDMGGDLYLDPNSKETCFVMKICL